MAASNPVLRISLIAVLSCISCAAYAETAACPELMKSASRLAASISETSEAYWKLRKDYIELKFGGKHALPDAERRAEEEEKAAAPLRNAMAENWDKITAVLADAQSKSCAPGNELNDLRLSAFSLTKRVKIDRFPEDE